MASAKWLTITNGRVSNECGVAEPDGEVGGGFMALKFDGLVSRLAVTQPLNLTAGGWIEAAIFLPPVGFDDPNGPFPLCNAAFSGTVEISYSVDGGNTWTIIHEVFPWETPGKNTFQQTKVPLPIGAWSEQTQFMFAQPTFEAALDNWCKFLSQLPRKQPILVFFSLHFLHSIYHVLFAYYCTIGLLTTSASSDTFPRVGMRSRNS